MRSLRRCRIDRRHDARLEFAQPLGNASFHAVEQRIEVHVAALARKALLKTRDATVAALFLEQLGTCGAAQRGLAALGRKIERCAGI